MDRVQARRIKDDDEERKREEAAILMPVLLAKSQADRAQAKSNYDSAIQSQANRASAYQLYDQARQDFDGINLITDDKARAAASREWLSRYAQLANVPELKNEMDQRTHLATSNISDSLKISMLKTAEERAFEGMTANAGLNPDDKKKAARVNLGLDPRASSAAIQYKEVVGPDGRTHLVAVDPRAVGAQVVGSGERYGSGVEGRPAGSPDAANVVVSQTPGEKAGEVRTAEESAKTKAELARDRPKKAAALKMAEASTARLADELDALVSKVSAATAGPGGVILDKFPGTTARDLESNLNAIKAVIGFQALQNMREASPTGGALGQVSDLENRLLQSQLGNLEIGQSPTQIIENLKKVRQRVVENFGITRAAFTGQYGESDPAANSSSSSDLSGMTTEQLQARLRQLRSSNDAKK